MIIDLDGIDVPRLVALLDWQSADRERQARFLTGLARSDEERRIAIGDAALLKTVADRLAEVKP